MTHVLDLRSALDEELTGMRTAELSAVVERLIGAYRSGAAPRTPILATAKEVAAYAAYRMPATAAVAGVALAAVASAMPDWEPRRLLDLGAGTGAMLWAAAETFESLSDVLALEQSADAIAFGRTLGRGGPGPVRNAAWQRWQLPGADAAADPGFTADLATSCYVLGELTDEQQERLVALAAAAAPTVVLVEPGTPAGYRRVLAARDRLLARGMTILAPCPHQAPCPLGADDWCHFAERVERSAVHRRVKGGDLSWEDEKFSFVAATRLPVTDPAAARIIRHPQQRKGLVALQLCAADGTARPELVTKRAGGAYKAARKADWGDRWDPSG